MYNILTKGDDLMNKSELTYSYGTRGYTVFYKGKPIYGVGIHSSANGCKANLRLFKQQAEMEINKILNNCINPFMQQLILKIDMEV